MIPISGDHGSSEDRLTKQDMEGDLKMTVREDERDEKGGPLIHGVKPLEWFLPNVEVYGEWEGDEQDDDVDIIDLYVAGDEGGNGSDNSDKIYGEEEIDEVNNANVEGE